MSNYEYPVDVLAVEALSLLVDELQETNEFDDSEGLNVFLTKLLFCIFAEDVGAFEHGEFSHGLSLETADDGSDLGEYLESVFDEVEFGFTANSIMPQFNYESRQQLIECCDLDWTDVNPDVFGSMFQSVVDEGKRGELGQHYTSVENIMKVINPLFLEELYELLEASKDSLEELNKLHDRVSDIKIMDPACGSGNFLIVAYKELRLFEIDLIKAKLKHGEDSKKTRISLANFYGIEYDNLPSYIAKIALCLAEQQINLIFNKEFLTSELGTELNDINSIIQGNSLRLDWNDVLPNNGEDEIYIIGNPPFNGSGSRSKEQNKDMEIVFKGFKSFKTLDYVASWFWKGAQYIANSKAKLALVSTNSVCQGSQVAVLFPPIFDLKLTIDFAYQSFKWTNNAKKNAGVHVVIVCLASETHHEYQKVV